MDPESGKHISPSLGLSKGSTLSPLLANIVLHELDTHIMGNISKKFPSLHPINPQLKRLMYLRYAEDFVILITGSLNDTTMIKN
jgi:retron-type reverse transcriptase